MYVKIYIACFLQMMVSGSFAQTYYTTTVLSQSSSATNSAGVALQGSMRYLRTAYIIRNTELSAAGFSNGNVFTGISFNYATAQDISTTGSLKIYMQNTANTLYGKPSNTWSNGSNGIIDPMTLVADIASVAIPGATGFWNIPFSGGSAFTYTGGGLYIAFEYQNPSSFLSSSNAAACNTALGATVRTANSGSGLPATLSTTTSFRPVTGLSLTVPLPITLAGFTGEHRDDKNIINWTTATESNCSGFELQRSSDGIDFTALAFIGSRAVNGNSSSAISYTTDDRAPLNGINYYRLNSIDLDHSYTYSEVISILSAKSNELRLTGKTIITDNMLELTITSPSFQQLSINITDMSGRLLLQKKIDAAKGDNRLQLAMPHLTAGMYVAKVASVNAGSASFRLVKY